MRVASFVMAALCWVLCGLAAMMVFVLIFKPRATDEDLLPAKVLYAASIGCGVMGLVIGLAAWFRSPPREVLQLAAPLLAAVGLALPAVIIWLVMQA